MQIAESYDYIVVGGGSSGCVVAARLAEEKAGSVLLLEAGNAAEKNPETMSADGFVQAFGNDDVMWDRLSDAQANCGSRRFYMGSGTGMGGSGAVNGMVYTRGDKLDFAQWPAGWQWNDVAPSFDALEKRLKVKTRKPTSFTDTCVGAARQAGFRQKDGLNDGELCGFIGYQMMNYDGDRRRSSYMAFIHGVKNENLVIKTDSLVHRVVFDETKCAVAVEYEQNGSSKKTVGVKKEVILCAGALETPKLLMLSGIGSSQQLQQFGIPEVMDSPSIGKNMQDHPTVCILYRGNKAVDSYYPQLYGFDRANKSSPMPENQADTCYVFFSGSETMKQSIRRMLPTMALPVSLYKNTFLRKFLTRLVNLIFMIPLTRSFLSRVYGIVVILGKPVSRGEVRLSSANPGDQALINPGFFADPQDMATLIDGVLRAQEIAQQRKLEMWGNRGLGLSASTKNREKIEKWIRGTATTTFHYAGTCRMGEGADSPVDLQLNVKGVKNLRVADASVIPAIPVSALNAPSMMIGYRAADFILNALNESDSEKSTVRASSELASQD